MNDHEIAMNVQQLKTGSLTLSQELHLSLFQPTADVALCGITISCDLFSKKPGVKVVLDNDGLTESFMAQFGSQVFRATQSLAMDFNGSKLGNPRSVCLSLGLSVCMYLTGHDSDDV